MKISVNCPSYKRPRVETLDYLPFCRVWVDPSEYADYVAANPPGADIVECAPGVQGNLCRVRNHILDREFGDGADVVLIIDDDMKSVSYFETDESGFAYARHIITADLFLEFVEKYSIMARDLGAFLWGLQVNVDPQCYRQQHPFSTIAYIGGPFQCFVDGGGGCRYDERLPLKEDYDMTLQQLNKHRVVLRVNKFMYDVKQAQQSGGCATYRNYEREKQQLEALRKKWGARIVRDDPQRDRSNRSKKERVRIDFNPVLSIPIRGV